MQINKAEIERIIKQLEYRRDNCSFWERDLKNSYTTTILTLEMILSAIK